MVPLIMKSLVSGTNSPVQVKFLLDKLSRSLSQVTTVPLPCTSVREKLVHGILASGDNTTVSKDQERTRRGPESLIWSMTVYHIVIDLQLL